MTESVEDVDVGMESMPDTTEEAKTSSESSLEYAIELVKALRAILREHDLETLSRRRVRLQLEDQFQTDLSTYKDFINSSILLFIREQQEVEEKEAKRKRPRKQSNPNPNIRNRLHTPYVEVCVSPELARVIGLDRCKRIEALRKLWAYIQEHRLQKANCRRVIRLDDTLKKVFKRDTMTNATIHRYLARHMRRPQDMPKGGWKKIRRSGASSDEEEEEKKVEPPKRKRRKKMKENDKRRHAKLNEKKVSVSPELAEVVGDNIPYAQVVKKMWDYIKEKDLQDPKDRRRIILDETLRKIFRIESVNAFTLNKYVYKHLKKPEDLPENGWDGVERVLPDDV